MPTLICDCNKTMPLQEKILGAALGEELTLHSSLCRREAGDFPAGHPGRRGSGGGLHPGKAAVRRDRQRTPKGRYAPVKFVNIRETGGWSRDAARSMPKIAALLAAAHLPDPEPVPTVTYKSAGRLLIIGPLEQAERGRGPGGRRAGRHRVRAGRRRRAGAPLPGARRTHRQPQGLARRVRVEMVGRQPDRPGPVHPLQCLRGRLPGRARSAWTTRSTWASARRTAPA